MWLSISVAEAPARLSCKCCTNSRRMSSSCARHARHVAQMAAGLARAQADWGMGGAESGADQRRNLSRLQPAKQLLLACERRRGEFSIAAAGRCGLEGCDRVASTHAAAVRDAIDGRAVWAAHVVQLAWLRGGKDSLAVVAADLGAASARAALSLRMRWYTHHVKRGRWTRERGLATVRQKPPGQLAGAHAPGRMAHLRVALRR